MQIKSISRSQSLNNISDKKLSVMLESISGEDIKKSTLLKTAYMRYAESNIPVDYWNRTMEKDFTGEKVLLDEYNDYVKDLNKSFIEGRSICFAGLYGSGKTLTISCILKKACQKGYDCLYTTLSDMVSVFTKAPAEEMYLARKELMSISILVIDEFDNRFFSTDASADLYARTLESVIRIRFQNKMPTLFCTNSPNIINSLNGSLKESIGSLFSGNIRTVVVMGEDHRKKVL